MNFFPCFILLLLTIQITADVSLLSQDKEKENQNNNDKNKDNNSIMLTLSATVPVSLSLHVSSSVSTEAVSLFQSWAKSLQSSSGTVSYSEAGERERLVVEKVERGIWSDETYHLYQRLAVMTGNVDSARLMMEYGLDWSVKKLLLLSSISLSVSEQVCRSVVRCEVEQFQSLLRQYSLVQIEMDMETGSTCLMLAVYVGCVDIVTMLLLEEEVEEGYLDKMGSHGMNAVMVCIFVTVVINFVMVLLLFIITDVVILIIILLLCYHYNY